MEECLAAERHVMGRNMIWKIYCKEGSYVFCVDMYIGSYYYIGTTVIFLHVKVGCMSMRRIGQRYVSNNTVLYILEYLNINNYINK